MYSILIKSESRFPIERRKLRLHLEQILAKAGLFSETEVSLAIVGERKIRNLNRQFASKDQATSVLSFSQMEDRAGEKFVTSPEQVLYLGDIVVCYPKAQELANKEGVLLDEEIAKLAEHGLWHLLGKHHE